MTHYTASSRMTAADCATSIILAHAQGRTDLSQVLESYTDQARTQRATKIRHARVHRELNRLGWDLRANALVRL